MLRKIKFLPKEYYPYILPIELSSTFESPLLVILLLLSIHRAGEKKTSMIISSVSIFYHQEPRCRLS